MAEKVREATADASPVRSVAWRCLVAGAVVVGLYVALHLATISTSRLPWFDDTFFSDVADSLRRTGELRLPVAPLWLDRPVYLYGPTYFAVLAGIFDRFGLGIAQARLPGLLCGFGILGVVFLILRRARAPAGLAAAATALLAIDPTFHQSIHSGRMDSMAMLFLLLAFYLVLRDDDDPLSPATGSVLLSALCGAAGALTTPRPGYLLAPVGLLLLVRWLRRRDGRSALQTALWGGVIALLLGSWIAYAFGSVGGMLQYYADFATDYASGGFGFRALHAPLLIPLALLLLAAAWLRPRILVEEVPLVTLAGIAGFYGLVKDKGAFGGLYSFFMVPLAYIALGYLLTRLGERRAPVVARARGLRIAIFGSLLAFNGAILVARSVLELVQREARSPASAESEIARWIPAGSRVVGDDKFYFAVRRAGSRFQYAQRGGALDERVRYHHLEYGLEYLITAEPDGAPLLEAYRKEIPLLVIATFAPPPEPPLAVALSALARRAGLGSSLTASYAGRVFARAPEAPSQP